MKYEDCNDCVANTWCTIRNDVREIAEKPWCDMYMRINTAVDLSRLPKIYRRANLYTYDEELKQEDYFAFTKGVVDNLDVVEEGRNVMFLGDVPGTGKTHNAAVILNHFIYKNCGGAGFDFENPIGLYVTHAELMDDLRYRRSEPEVIELLRQVNKVPLLMIDDLGSGTSSPFTRDQTFLIVNNRVNEGLPTIYTTNINPVKLAERDVLGTRNVSRIMSNMSTQLIKGADQRLQGLRRGR